MPETKFIDMKKTLLFVVTLVVLGSSSVMAQGFAFGLKAGVNYSSIKTADDLIDQNSILGYQVGVFTRLGGLIHLQPELYLVSKGNEFVSFEDEAGNEVPNGTVEFTSLDLPVLLGTKLGPLRIMAGPVISFVVDKNTDFDSAYEDVSDFDDYKNQAIGIQAGGGLDLGKFTVDLRYEAGLSNVSESDKYNQKLNLFQVSLGFRLL